MSLFVPRYHVPRSQVWEGSRGRQVNAPASGLRMFDSAGLGNAGGDFAPDPGIAYVNCVHGASVLVDPSRYGWVPAFDIDGKPRVAGAVKAGAYA